MEVEMEHTEVNTSTNSNLNVNGLQTEQVPPQELKEFVVQDSIGTRRPSVLEKESETCQCCSLKPKGRAYRSSFHTCIQCTPCFD